MFSKIRRLVMKQFTVCPRTGKITGLKIVKRKSFMALDCSWTGLCYLGSHPGCTQAQPCYLSLSKGGSTV